MHISSKKVSLSWKKCRKSMLGKITPLLFNNFWRTFSAMFKLIQLCSTITAICKFIPLYTTLCYFRFCYSKKSTICMFLTLYAFFLLCPTFEYNKIPALVSIYTPIRYNMILQSKVFKWWDFIPLLHKKLCVWVNESRKLYPFLCKKIYLYPVDI